MVEDTLRSDKVQIERKTFLFTLKENPRGRFLRITEDVNGRRDTIIIPATGLEDFRRIVDDMVRSSRQVVIASHEPVIEAVSRGDVHNVTRLGRISAWIHTSPRANGTGLSLTMTDQHILQPDLTSDPHV